MITWTFPVLNVFEPVSVFTASSLWMNDWQTASRRAKKSPSIEYLSAFLFNDIRNREAVSQRQVDQKQPPGDVTKRELYLSDESSFNQLLMCLKERKYIDYIFYRILLWFSLQTDLLRYNYFAFISVMIALIIFRCFFVWTLYIQEYSYSTPLYKCHVLR